jgi:ribosomal protein S18 acetylase RimI-like enzyme
MKIRCLAERDFDFALAQTSREGWDTTRESFEVHLLHDPDGGFVAEIDGRPVGMVSTTRYRRTGWMGELIVSPDHRKQGIGTALMERGIQCLEGEGVRTIRLEADPAGIPIYRKLGFEDEYESPRLRLQNVPRTAPGAAVEASSQDLAVIAELDARIFGDDRSRLLRELFVRARAVYTHAGQGTLTGYLMVQRSRAGARLGPWVATEPRVAEDLLKKALSELESETVIIALPRVNGAGIELLDRYGFVETPASYRMVRGPRVADGSPEQVYAVVTGAFG